MTQAAQDAYLAQHTKAAALLQELEEALFDQPAPDGEIAIDWSHVGSVTELNRQLENALMFIKG
jgi:hypothetical protein